MKGTVFALAMSFLCLTFQSQAQTLPSFADLVEKVQPSVVNISTIKPVEENEDADFVSDIPQIEEFLQKKNPQQVSLGSGFILDANGFIITNNHVIDGAEEITVTTSNNKKFSAKLVGKDTKTDIALIKIDHNEPFIPLLLGDSDNIRVGDWVLAIGNPFGLGGSVSAGIVSAKSRDIESGPYDNFIQTDASINQGSSGGPMLNLNGEVIGVNTAIFSTSGGNMGIGFAMPVNQIKFVIDSLKAIGKVERGWIGLKIQPNSEDIASSLNQKNVQGVMVSSVTPQSPAALAGIEAGDIILSFDGQSINETRSFSRLVAETPIGKKASLTIWRRQKELPLSVLVEKMPEEAPKQPFKSDKKKETSDYNIIGLRLSELTPEIINAYQLKTSQQGILITDVKPQSDAERKGVKKGGIITHLDKKSVFDMNDIRTYLDDAKAENYRPVLLLIEENGIPHYAAVKLEKNEQN